MPNTGPCPYCKRAGFVRFETVISKGTTHRAFYCGRCNRTWNTDEQGHRLTGEHHDSHRPRKRVTS